MFFSTDPSTGINGKSILWCLGYFAMGGLTSANAIVANHPDGIYAMWHYVK
jgi:hypothetical protein